MHTNEDRLAAGTENTPQRRRNGRRRPTEGRSRPAFAWPTHQPAKNAGGRVALAAAELRGAKTPHAVGRRTGAHPTWRRATIERREEATFARLPMSGRRKTPEGPSRMPPANSLAGKCLLRGCPRVGVHSTPRRAPRGYTPGGDGRPRRTRAAIHFGEKTARGPETESSGQSSRLIPASGYETIPRHQKWRAMFDDRMQMLKPHPSLHRATAHDEPLKTGVLFIVRE
jgi:hypothetical protein